MFVDHSVLDLVKYSTPKASNSEYLWERDKIFEVGMSQRKPRRRGVVAVQGALNGTEEVDDSADKDTPVRLKSCIVPGVGYRGTKPAEARGYSL